MGGAAGVGQFPWLRAATSDDVDFSLITTGRPVPRTGNRAATPALLRGASCRVLADPDDVLQVWRA
jgi:hypothetical protein